MINKPPITATTVVQAKEQAKQIKKTMKLKTVGASLNELAKINGYKNWNAFRTALIDDEAVKGQTLYSMDVNEQAFRSAGIIMDISIPEIDTFVAWFHSNFPKNDISFFEDKKDIIELLNNHWNVPTGVLYAYVAYNGMTNMDNILKLNKMDHLDFERFSILYSVDFDIHDFTLSKDFFIALNEDAYKDFPEIMDAFKR